MCGSEELIHDARQVDLEEMIMTKDVQHYLVPGRLTDVQRRVVRLAISSSMDRESAFIRAVQEVGTPIQPCADVETVGYHTVFPSGLVGFTDKPSMAERRERKGASNTPLVRRTDMEAQVARVAAEKDAVIARLREALDRVEHIGRAVERKGATTGPHWIQFGVALSIARSALNEGAAG